MGTPYRQDLGISPGDGQRAPTPNGPNGPQGGGALVPVLTSVGAEVPGMDPGRQLLLLATTGTACVPQNPSDDLSFLLSF